MNRGGYEIFENLAKLESLKLSSNNFVARTPKSHKIIFVVGAIFFASLGAFLAIFDNPELSIAMFIMGAIFMLLLPTLLTYKLYVNHSYLSEEYYVLFIKIINKVKWGDIKFKKITKVHRTNPSRIASTRITFYNSKKKRLMIIFSDTVGFDRIVKMAKNKNITKF